jgi:hypothetical protein
VRLAPPVATLLLAATSAHADDLTPVNIRATLDEATAVFHVRYTASVDGVMIGEVGDVHLPEHAIIVGGVATDATGAHPLELVPAQRASDALAAIVDRPGKSGRRWAVAVTGTFIPSITVAAPGSGQLAVELTISAPTCFHDDRRYVAVPPSWKDRLPADLRVPATAIAGVERDCGGDRMQRLWAGLPSRELHARPAGVHRVGAVASRLVLGSMHLAMVELTVAGRLGDVPADLATAILVDASRSMTPAQLEAQHAIVASYLRAAPASRVQVLAYARDVRPLLPGWTAATAAQARLDRELRGLVRRNGSNVDAALREAAAWLARIDGTRRIIVLGDVRLADRFGKTPSTVLAGLVPARTLVHTVAIGSDGKGVMRDDDGTLAALASATRGINVQAGLTDLDATQLARPTSLDHARLDTPGWTSFGSHHMSCRTDADSDMALVEGSSCRWYGTSERPNAQPLVVTGMLWGERVTRVVRPEPSRALELARELSASRSLDTEHQLLADVAARAVNSAWSLYGEWGPTGGYAETGLGFGGGRGWGTLCGGSCAGGLIGHGSGTGSLRVEPHLDRALAAVIARCTDRAHPRLRAVVETTGEEIVDVAVTTGDAALRSCVEDALWNAWLVVPSAPPRARTVVELEARS